MLSSHSIHISLSNEKNAGRDSSTSGVTDLAIQKRVSEMQRPPLDRPGPRIGDMIKRFRTATPTSRETRQETRQPEASRFWWETGPARQAEPLPEYAAPQQDWRQSDSFTHVMDGLDMELDRAGLVSALNRSHRRYGGVHTDSLLSLPDVLALHQSLEVDVIAPPPAKEEEKPAEPDTKESVATILESLDVTMARLNWRYVYHFHIIV